MVVENIRSTGIYRYLIYFLYHKQSLQEGKYDKYHPEFYGVDREHGYI